ncbi:MAG: hypothetical protein ACPHCI_00400 [Solirubrobacterales bacterium]
MDRTLTLAGLALFVVAISLAFRFISKRRHAIARISLGDLAGHSADPLVVIFTSPYCHGCRLWIEELTEREAPTHAIDLAEHPEAAARYRINHTPRVAVVRSATGVVIKEFDHYTPRRHDLDSIVKLLNPGSNE